MPKILNFVEKINYYCELFTSLLRYAAAQRPPETPLVVPAPAPVPPAFASTPAPTSGGGGYAQTIEGALARLQSLIAAITLGVVPPPPPLSASAAFGANATFESASSSMPNFAGL